MDDGDERFDLDKLEYASDFRAPTNHLWRSCCHGTEGFRWTGAGLGVAAHYAPLGKGQANYSSKIAKDTPKERRAVAGTALDWTYRPAPPQSWRASERKKAPKPPSETLGKD